MSARSNHRQSTTPLSPLDQHLASLKLSFIAEQYAALATQAADKAWSHVDYLARLMEGEADVRGDRATKSRMRVARFPVMKTLDQFRWDWPTRLNRLQVHNHFRLAFLQDKANLILLGGVGLGKPQPGHCPSRSPRCPGTNPHRPCSPSPAVWSHVHTDRDDVPYATWPLLCGPAAAPCGAMDPRTSDQLG